MKTKNFSGGGILHLNRYYVVLEKDEEIISKIKEFAKYQNVKGGSIKGIGTLKDPELGFFDLNKKEYKKQIFKGDFELLSMDGNISTLNDELIIHIHALISDSEFRTLGGHLFSGKITGTAEIIIDYYGEKLKREHCNESNLNLLKI